MDDALKSDSLAKVTDFPSTPATEKGPLREGLFCWIRVAEFGLLIRNEPLRLYSQALSFLEHQSKPRHKEEGITLFVVGQCYVTCLTERALIVNPDIRGN